MDRPTLPQKTITPDPSIIGDESITPDRSATPYGGAITNATAADHPHDKNPEPAACRRNSMKKMTANPLPTAHDWSSKRRNEATSGLCALVALFLVLTAGCDSVDDDGRADPDVAGVLVVNQGNFGDGNGSVSVYDPVTGQVRPAAIANLGSILQSAALIDGLLYLTANTGERIDVFDAETLERIAQITDVVSPRYLLARGETAYVTSLYGAPGSFSGGLVTLLDLGAHEKIGEIAVGDNPEGMALVGDRLYVANFGFGEDSTVSVIDVEAEEVVETIDVDCDGPRFLVVDADDEVFVFCTGRTIYDENFEPIGETDGAVRVLDGLTGGILERHEIDGRIGTDGPGQDAFHDEASRLIYVVRDASTVLVFDTDGNQPIREIGPFDGDPIGAVAYDGELERLYLGRVAGFVEAGEVTIHGDDGSELGRFTAGVAPAYIAFVRRAE